MLNISRKCILISFLGGPFWKTEKWPSTRNHGFVNLHSVWKEPLEVIWRLSPYFSKYYSCVFSRIQNNIVCSDRFLFKYKSPWIWDAMLWWCYDRYFPMKFRRASRCRTVVLALDSGTRHLWELRRHLPNQIGVFAEARKHRIIWSCQWSLGIEICFNYDSVKTNIGKNQSELS